MNKTVYIVICYIPAYDNSTTKVDIFETLEQAQAYKHRQELRGYIVFCDIYKAQKVE